MTFVNYKSVAPFSLSLGASYDQTNWSSRYINLIHDVAHTSPNIRQNPETNVYYYQCDACKAWFDLDVQREMDFNSKVFNMFLPHNNNLFVHNTKEGKKCVGHRSYLKLPGEHSTKVIEQLVNWFVVRPKEDNPYYQTEPNIWSGCVCIVCEKFFSKAGEYVRHIKESFSERNLPVFKKGSPDYFTSVDDDLWVMNASDLKNHRDVYAHCQYPIFKDDAYRSADGQKTMSVEDMVHKDDIFKQYFLYHVGDFYRQSKVQKVKGYRKNGDDIVIHPEIVTNLLRNAPPMETATRPISPPAVVNTLPDFVTQRMTLYNARPSSRPALYPPPTAQPIYSPSTPIRSLYPSTTASTTRHTPYARSTIFTGPPLNRL